MSIRSTRLGHGETLRTPLSAKTTFPLPMQYCSVSDWIVISGLGRTKTYEMLADRRLKSIKVDGKRLIDLPHGLSYLDNLGSSARHDATGADQPDPK